MGIGTASVNWTQFDGKTVQFQVTFDCPITAVEGDMITVRVCGIDVTASRSAITEKVREFLAEQAKTGKKPIKDIIKRHKPFNVLTGKPVKL